MQPTIDALLAIDASHPENARVRYEVSGAYETACRVLGVALFDDGVGFCDDGRPRKRPAGCFRRGVRRRADVVAVISDGSLSLLAFP